MDRPPPEPPASEGVAAHRHGWSVVDFLVLDDRPMMRQRCACGAQRNLPAWNRSWEPPTQPTDPDQR